MFEKLELGRKVGKEDFDEAALKLRRELLALQFECRDKPFPVILIVAGAEGAGKGSVVHRLNEWMDPSLIETRAFWYRSDEEDAHPRYWRFWRTLPAHGITGVFFGSWYTHPITDRAAGKLPEDRFDAEMQRINEFEQMLADDGALIVKLWLHVSEKSAWKNLKRQTREQFKELDIPLKKKPFLRRHRSIAETAAQAIHKTNAGHAPWHLIEAEDSRYLEITAGETLQRALAAHLARASQPPPDAKTSARAAPPPADQPTVLSAVPLDRQLQEDEYKKQVQDCQDRLRKLFWQARRRGVSAVAVFEGWDAAGKGSALRRLTQAIDPRLFRLVQFAAPTDEERAHHYLWRFWRHVPRDGSSTFFDRSWYGRVLVERVEGFARPEEWQRAYGEINRFEKHLADHGIALFKFWLHISKGEQLARFREREKTPHKRHKITDEDWRNRERWEDYEQAVHDMVSHTSTDHAPWTLVAGNDKRHARVQILRTIVEGLEERVRRAS